MTCCACEERRDDVHAMAAAVAADEGSVAGLDSCEWESGGSCPLCPDDQRTLRCAIAIEIARAIG